MVEHDSREQFVLQSAQLLKMKAILGGKKVFGFCNWFAIDVLIPDGAVIAGLWSNETQIICSACSSDAIRWVGIGTTVGTIWGGGAPAVALLMAAIIALPFGEKASKSVRTGWIDKGVTLKCKMHWSFFLFCFANKSQF